uniref:Ankyrin repeat and SOCS box containing 15b n=1 Tax=Oryzias sinensis TaxID=183150 RepID=A0A8C7ZGM4_9TELE
PIKMEDVEQEAINEELIKFAIQESIQDAYKFPSSVDKNRYEALSCCESTFQERDGRGWMPLHAAAVQPHPEVLQVVLQAADFPLEEQTLDGDTALTLAAEADRVANVKMLLQHGASPHNTNGKNESPLLLAVKQRSYEMVYTLVMGGAFVEQVCLTKWRAIHEAAKVGCSRILMLLLRHGANISARDGHGVTPLGIAAEHGKAEALDILIQHGGDVNAQASNGDTVLYDASGSGNLDCIKLLLLHGANPNVASYACQLPIHRAAYEGHILALRTLIPITTQRAIRLSGQSPVHSAADGGQAECLELLLQKGYNVNAVLDAHISENYGDLRKTPLFFAVSNGDVTCSEMLLAAGAKTDLDPLRCILVAVRAERYELVQLLLSRGAEINCYFRVISNTVFPTALQYCIRDPAMLRLLLNHGYHAHKCFECCHKGCEDVDGECSDLHNQVYCIYSQPSVISFCEFVSVSWLTHLVGSVVKMLLDYVSQIRICFNLRRLLERTPEWEEISTTLSSPRSLQHLCRLVVRSQVSIRTLNDPEAMAAAPFPPRVTSYITYREQDPFNKTQELKGLCHN